MKIRVILDNGKFQYYTLSSRIKLNFELFKRLEIANYNWEFVHVSK